MDKTQFQTTSRDRNSYGMFVLGQNIFFGLVGVMTVYLTDVGLSATMVASILLLVKIWDLIGNPIMGVIIDKANFKSGKFLPWIRMSVFLVPITTILLFSIQPEMPMLMKIIWATVSYILWDFAYTICDTPIFGLATAMTDSVVERVMIISKGRLYSNFAMIITIILPIIYPTLGWTVSILLVSVVGVIFLIPIAVIGKERNFVLNQQRETFSIKEIFTQLIKNKYLFAFWIAVAFVLITSCSTAVGIYVATYNLGNTALAGIAGVAFMVPGVIAAIIIPRIMIKVDKFKILIISLIAYTVLTLAQFIVGYSNLIVYIVMLMLKSSAFAVFFLLVFMFSPDFVEYGAFHGGKRSEGLIFSIQSLMIKLCTALMASVTMFILGAVGFVEGVGAVQSQKVVDTIWFLFTGYAAIGAVIALVILLVFYKLKDREVQIYAYANQGKISREDAIIQLNAKNK